MTRRAANTVTAPAQVLDEVLAELDPQTWIIRNVVPSATSRTLVRGDQGQLGTTAVAGVGNGTRRVRASSPRRARRLPQTRRVRRIRRLRRAQPLRWTRWVLRALVVGLACAAAVWAVAVLGRFSGVFQVCAVVTFLYTAGALWYVAVGQYAGGSTAPTRRSRPRPTAPASAPEGRSLRAIEGPRALALPAPPVTVTVTAVQDLGGGPR